MRCLQKRPRGDGPAQSSSLLQLLAWLTRQLRNEKYQQRTRLYSTTLSASKKTDSGIVRPRAFCSLESIQRGENCDLRGQSSLLNGRFCHIVAGLGTHTELLLAFWTSIGFKPGDFITTGMNEKRTAWLCRVLNRVTHPRSLRRFKLF